MSNGRLEPADPATIDGLLREHWGLPIVSIDREYMPEDLEGLIWRDETATVQGLVTWAVDGENAEIVSVDTFTQAIRVGGRLLDGAEAELRDRGVRRLTVVTTADNLRAIAFYVRRGYRLVRLDLDGMDRVRRIKPGLPLHGIEGIPLRDMYELEKSIADAL